MSDHETDDLNAAVGLVNVTEALAAGMRVTMIGPAGGGGIDKPRKIVTSHIYPPIPIREYDWCAYFDDVGADCSPYGWGATEAAAKADLLDNVETESGSPRRCETDWIGAAGECLACDAEAGQGCKNVR